MVNPHMIRGTDGQGQLPGAHAIHQDKAQTNYLVWFHAKPVLHFYSILSLPLRSKIH